MEIRMACVEDSTPLSNYYNRNALHLENAGPKREEGYDTPSAWQQRLAVWAQEHEQGRSAHFIGLSANGDIIGMCTLSNITYGGFMACHMGYHIDKNKQGQGLMTAICEKAIQHAFKELKLNRVMANYMPDNTRSENILKRMGFTIEGHADRYLKINGKWQAHVLTSLLNPEVL